MAKEKKAPATRTLSARVPAATLKALRQRALAEDRSVQDIINQLVEEFLGRKRSA